MGSPRLRNDLSLQDFGGWRLAPEGAVVHAEERVAVIADVHLGYEWARGAGGDCMPAHSLSETLAQLTTLLARVAITRLVIAGDLVESPAPCARTAADVRRLKRWLHERGITLLALAGNHDRTPSALPDALEIAGWTIAHGHRPIAGARTISGHYHPVLRAGGICAPCFLAGPLRIVLPAFSPNAAGFAVTSATIPAAWRDPSLHCLAYAAGDWLDFGSLADLSGTPGVDRTD